MRRLDIDPKLLAQLIEQDGLTQAAAAKRLGASTCWVERACKRLGLRTQRTGPRSGAGHPDWKGGRYKLGLYWYVWAKGHPNATKVGYVAEHRLRMVEALGRPLRKGEVVHHIDGDPENNAIGNLQLFDANGRHLLHELTGRTPRWTPEGRATLAKGHGREANFLKTLKPCGPEHTRTIRQKGSKRAPGAPQAS
jgi:HNH endonuclease